MEVNTDANNLITGETDHCHEPDIRAMVAYKQCSSVKVEARITNFRSCQQVYSQKKVPKRYGSIRVIL